MADGDRTGRAGQTARERDARREAFAFAQTPEGRTLNELKATVTKLEAKVTAQAQEITTMKAKQEEHSAIIAKLEMALKPRGAYQTWGSGAAPIADWQDSAECA